MWKNDVLSICDKHNIECKVIDKGLVCTSTQTISMDTKEAIKETVPEGVSVSFKVLREKIIQTDEIINLRVSLGRCKDFDDLMKELF